MDSDNRYLSVWYKRNDASQIASIISRKSSARQREAVDGVCEYKLCPILKENADMLLYNTVWDIVTHPNFYDFFEDMDFLNSNILRNINDKRVKYFRPYLIYPSEELCTEYSAEEFNYPYIIAVYAEEDPIMGIDDDIYFSHYFVPEWDFTNQESEVVYRECSHNDDVSIPLICNTPQTLENAISDLLIYLESVPVDIGIWKERFIMTVEMLKTHANELHILHNAGLYDIDSLWPLLLQSDTDKKELRIIVRNMESELHRYVMMAVNLIDWKRGGFNNENALK